MPSTAENTPFPETIEVFGLKWDAETRGEELAVYRPSPLGADSSQVISIYRGKNRWFVPPYRFNAHCHQDRPGGVSVLRSTRRPHERLADALRDLETSQSVRVRGL